MPKIVSHFVVTHPLGMHARVCSKWIKTLQKIRPEGLEYSEEWAWIIYNDEKIPADSLFKLLETRIPCSAEFDLLMQEEDCKYDATVGEELSNIISQEAFDANAT